MKIKSENSIVPVVSLYHECDLSNVSFETTNDLELIQENPGQSRAMEALRFGIGMRHEGYNLYVLGSTGLGKHTAVNKLLVEESKTAKIPSDWCYINNFEQYHKPDILQLPAGRAHKLQLDMQQLVEDILVSIPSAFESEEYQTQINKFDDEYKAREEAVFSELSEKAEKENIVMLRTPGGYTLGPAKDNKILTPEDFDTLPKQEQERIKASINEIERELKEVLKKIPLWQKERRERIKALNREVSEITIEQFIRELKSSYTDLPEVFRFIGVVNQDIIENVEVFRKFGEKKISGGNNNDTIKSVFSRYFVNLLVDNTATEGAPVIYEDNPTYQNLVGRVEHIAQYGTLITDFTLIKPGALHRANGGYLILDARKLLMIPFAWEALKRVLRSREIRIESIEQILSFASTISLQPEPVPIDIKVVLTGSRLLYYLLKQYDPEFSSLFKVTADFSEEIDRDDKNSELYAKLIATLQRENNLSSINKKGVARIIEYCSRMADDAEKISLHMGDLVDLLRESDYWARQENRHIITDRDVDKVFNTRRHRLDQLNEQLREQMLRGIHLIDTSGEKIAQINGLSIIKLGDYAFGRPSRITATARLGTGQVIDIEREADLGGSIHSKGVLILTSYLANRYAKNQPLSLSASLVFEQSYGLIEGDSASSAELCALLSALGELPLKQSIAVTGSVNQHGEIQAIGGVNEKIEAFYDLCYERGLTGEQGVIIPQANTHHLMLRHDVREAVRNNRFTIYAVDFIDTVMELLTGLEIGLERSNGTYPVGSVNYSILKRLKKFGNLSKAYSNTPKSTKNKRVKE